MRRRGGSGRKGSVRGRSSAASSGTASTVSAGRTRCSSSGPGRSGTGKGIGTFFRTPACRSGSRIEYLGAQRYEEIGRFESAIRGLHPPVPEWADFSGRRDREVAAPEVRSGTAGPDVASDHEGEDAVPGEASRFIRLDGGAGRDPFPAAVGWQSRLRRDDAEAPNAVFFGGTISRAYLGVFRKPLATPDFARIWNVTAGEDGSMERGAD